MFSLTPRFKALVQVCSNSLVDRQMRNSSKTLVPNNSHKISINFVQLKSLHKFSKAFQSCSGQTKWPWILQLLSGPKGECVNPLSKHLTFFFHQIFEGLPFHIIGDVADKDTVSFVHMPVGFEAPASTSLLGPLLPAWIGLMLPFPIHCALSV